MDMKHIQRQFDEVIAYSQNMDIVNTDKLFEQWLNAKRDFIEVFGGEPIYVCPEKVSFELSHKEKMLRVNDFIESVSLTFDNVPLADFIEANKETFFNNIVENGIIESSDVKIPKGMKLVKSFKFFEKDKKTLEELQNKASMIIQEDKIEGYLCFSVHPLDYLSSSENTYNWRSCHSLDGEYRAGNLSYMLDSSTIVCYLKSDKENNLLPNFPDSVMWNSKKWRMLLFMSDHWNAMYAGRQYPFFSDVALNLVQNKAIQLLGTLGNWSQWHNDEISSYDFETRNENEPNETVCFKNVYIPMKGALYVKTDLITDGVNSQHFNDLLRSSCYTPYYCWNKSHWKNIHFSIGEEAPCLRCGTSHIVVTDSVMCSDCELEYGNSEDEMFIHCDCCGRRIIYDDSWFVESTGENICESCMNSECMTCESCGELFYKRDIKYDKYVGEYRCFHCHTETQKERERLMKEYNFSRL